MMYWRESARLEQPRLLLRAIQVDRKARRRLLATAHRAHHLQAPTSLPAGTSHFLEAHTVSRLHGAPAGCGGLHT